jgi:uncharacterized protein YndB with AHSA1/START domain
MDKPTLVYTIYVAATAQKLWRGLTDPDSTEQYFGGNRVESDWKVGSDFILRMADGRIDVKGEVLECEPPRFMAVTWAQQTDLSHLPPARVSYRITPHGEVCGLTLSVTPEGEIPGEILAAQRLGWAMILSGLKSLLETGKPLPITVEAAMKAIGEGSGQQGAGSR